MANQHTKKPSTTITEKCINPDCSNQVKRIAAHVKSGKRKNCSKACAAKLKRKEPVIKKCADPDCEVMVSLNADDISHGKKYCSPACAYKKASLPRKYKPEDIAWIIENTGKVTREDMAKKFGVKKAALVRMLSIFRLQGHAIPITKGNSKGSGKRSPLYPGQQNWINDNYRKKSIVELADALNLPSNQVLNYVQGVNRRSAGVVLTKKKQKPKTQKVKQAQHVAQREHHDRKPPVTPFKQKEQVFKTRVVTTEGRIPVRFNDKNHTIMWAVDEAHAERIRVTYGYLNKSLLARL